MTMKFLQEHTGQTSVCLHPVTGCSQQVRQQSRIIQVDLRSLNHTLSEVPGPSAMRLAFSLPPRLTEQPSFFESLINGFLPGLAVCYWCASDGDKTGVCRIMDGMPVIQPQYRSWNHFHDSLPTAFNVNCPPCWDYMTLIDGILL